MKRLSTLRTLSPLGRGQGEGALICVLLLLASAAPVVQADIFQWEYINPGDPGQGKQQSTALCPDGAGVDAVPSADLQYRVLTMAYLISADLNNAYGYGVNLSNADLTNANLTNGEFWFAVMADANLSQANLSGRFGYATLTGADFTGADVRGADFSRDEFNGGTGLTVAQLSSTANYAAHDLSGIALGGNNLSGANLAGQNLTSAHFYSANLTNANLSQATLTNVFLDSANLSGANLHQADLKDANAGQAVLTNADLSQTNLMNASFWGATLSGADFAGAEVRGASFYRHPLGIGTGLTPAQLYSTANYQAHDLSGITLVGNNLSSANLAGQNLTNADFAYATVTSTDFTGANVRGANFSRDDSYGGTGLTVAQLSSTANYVAHDLSGIVLSGNNLSSGNLAGQNLANTDLSNANLTNANLSQADLNHANLISANLTNANLNQANFSYANLGSANFTGADVQRANFTNSNITNAQLASTTNYQAHDLSGINLDGTSLGTHVGAASFAGVNFSDSSLVGTTFGSSLSNANFTRANLTGARIYGGPLTNVNFDQANLTDAAFVSIDATNANFNQANLTNATFSNSTVTGANFNQANLTNATFSNSTVTGANFTGAEVRGAYFGDITATQLYSTASYQARDLTGIRLEGNLSGVNFVGQNLTKADLRATLTNANLSGAVVTGVRFDSTTSRGFTKEQLYSTASYAAHDLSGINLTFNNLTSWDFHGQNLTNASFHSATLSGTDFAGAEVRGASFAGSSGLTAAQLYSTASYQAHDLTGIDLGGLVNGIGLPSITFTNANFTGQNLTNANFRLSTLTGANFTGAIVRGVDFYRDSTGGVTPAQLYSTASYLAHDLRGIRLSHNNLAGVNLAGQNLSGAFLGANLANANLSQANLQNATLGCCALLTGANLTGADNRGNVFAYDLTGATTTNFIRHDGHINGLDLSAGQVLLVRDYDGNPYGQPIPITVDQHLVMGAGGVLQMVFEEDDWGSTISFAAGIPVALGGTLELAFADGVSLASQIGRTIDVFDWTGVSPTGTFAVDSPYVWDVSNLYTSGEVTFAALAGLAGDFNNDNAVDAADYVVWRKGLGTTYTQAAYNVWRANFGQTAGSGSALPSAGPLSAGVPEPASFALAVLGVLGLVSCAWRRQPRSHDGDPSSR